MPRSLFPGLDLFPDWLEVLLHASIPTSAFDSAHKFLTKYSSMTDGVMIKEARISR